MALSAPAVLRQVVPGTLIGTRSYTSTALQYTREETLDRLDSFHAAVLSSNWADYLVLVYNMPFWEAELEKLSTLVQPYLHEPSVGSKFADTQEMMDVLYKCEDRRDFINELCE